MFFISCHGLKGVSFGKANNAIFLEEFSNLVSENRLLLDLTSRVQNGPLILPALPFFSVSFPSVFADAVSSTAVRGGKAIGGFSSNVFWSAFKVRTLCLIAYAVSQIISWIE